MSNLMLPVLGGILIFFTITSIFSRYKKCPSDSIMVIYGKVGKTGEGIVKSARCIHGGAAFVWPLIQEYELLDLTPLSIEVNLKDALSKQNIRINVPSRFTVGISTEPHVIQNAAERLLGLPLNEVKNLAKDIIVGQLRLVVATMEIEEINTDRDKFLENIAQNVEAELNKIGLRLINVNVTDIQDDCDYIKSLGKEAAAQAINEARKKVAEKDRDGAIGEANAKRDERIKVAETNASAVEGENKSEIKIANSEANKREKEAEANRRAEAAEKVQAAKALQESYQAEKEAELSRAEREKATQKADVLVEAEIEKEKIEVNAKADAEEERIKAQGEADAIFSRMEAEARGIEEKLSKQAEGLENIIKAANNDPDKAVKLMITDKLPELVKIQMEAIKEIDIDKITVWDSGGGNNGRTSTANFLSGMAKSVPPLKDIFDQAGMKLPSYLGTDSNNKEKEQDKPVEPVETE